MRTADVVGGSLVALTLPGLVLILLLAGIVEQVAARARRRRGGGRTPGGVTAVGLDVLQAALAPEKRHTLEEKHSEQLRRDDVEDGAPPHSTVDLDAGIARLRLPGSVPPAT